LRGEKAKMELINFGIDPDRILVDSAGESAPIADNRREEGRRKNRRVELLLLPRK
jgi:outer membrane protein OmpA-like peptidoglycan-associated protein